MISKELSNFFKGLAIILVVFSHCIATFGIRYATPLGGIGVAIFLILSGYGLNESYKKKGLENFWKNRLIRVYIPYLIIVIINQIIMHEGIKKFLSNIFLVNTPNFLWFIKFILLNYINFYVINKIVKHKILRYLIWILFSILVFLMGSSLQAEQAFTFFIGIMLSDNQNLFNNYKGRKVLINGLLFILLAGVCLALKQLDFIRSSQKYIYYCIEFFIKNCGAMGIICIYGILFKKIKYFNNIFQKIGKLSYELYLVHAIMFFILRNNPNIINLALFLILTIVLTIVLFRINTNLKVTTYTKVKNGFPTYKFKR